MILRRCAGHALRLEPCRVTEVDPSHRACSQPLLGQGGPAQAFEARIKLCHHESGLLEIAS